MLHLGVTTRPVYCTKIASQAWPHLHRPARPEGLDQELLGRHLKAQQCSDWGAPTLTPEQVAYAASDVTSPARAESKLDVMLSAEGRTELAAGLFRFPASRACWIWQAGKTSTSSPTARPDGL